MQYNEDYLEDRLNEWADFFCRVRNFGLGYPHLSPEGKLIRDGGAIVKVTGPIIPPHNDNAQEIEDYVKELSVTNGGRHALLAAVLRAKYFADKNATVAQIAKRMNLSRPRFNELLTRAKLWVEFKLTSKMVNIKTPEKLAMTVNI